MSDNMRTCLYTHWSCTQWTTYMPLIGYTIHNGLGVLFSACPVLIIFPQHPPSSNKKRQEIQVSTYYEPYIMSVCVVIHLNNMSICMLSNYSSISHLKWHIIYIVFLFIVYCYPPLAAIGFAILLHVISLCVTIIIPSWNFICLFIVRVCLCCVLFFFKLF